MNTKKLTDAARQFITITEAIVDGRVPATALDLETIKHFCGLFLVAMAPAPDGLDPARKVAEELVDERWRQITHGYDDEHDDHHVNDEIAALAAFWIMPDGARDWDASSTSYGDTLGEAMIPEDWGMPDTDVDRRTQLVRGATCALAEILRLDREAARGR